MFEIGGTYKNRNGTYTILEMGPVKMKVRYEDGSEAELRIAIQERIWENIQADVVAKQTRTRKKKAGASVKHYIKSVAVMGDEDLTMPVIRTKVTPCSEAAPTLNIGDRFIYYSVSAKAFFAVATITGEAKVRSVKDFSELNFTGRKVRVYPVDIDAFAPKMSQAVWLDSVELESQPQFRMLLDEGETYLVINEDDFELLAEALAEYAEDDENGIDSDLDDDSDDEDGDGALDLEDELDI